MAVITLLGFLLWRLFRRCCMCCCMRESCAINRAASDPKKVLSGWGYWISKILILLFALAAFCFMIAGMATAEKDLAVKIWEPLNRLTGYLSNTTNSMDALITSLDGVNPILDNLTSIANNDINFAAIKSNLADISTFLDLSAANPNTIDGALRDLDTSVSSARSQMAALKSSMAAQQPNITAFANGMSPLSTAVSTFTDYSNKLTALAAQFTTLTGTASTPYNPTALTNAMAAVNLTAWQPNVDAMVAALDVWRYAKDTLALSTLANAARDLNTLVGDIKNSKLPSASNAITNFLSAWSTYGPAFAAIIARVDSVQATVVRLDAGSTAALDRLRTINANITALLAKSPTPATLATNLNSLSSELSLGPISSLVTDLTNMQNAIANVPDANINGARTAIAAVKTALDALAAKKDATAVQLTTYTAAQNNLNLGNLKATVSGAGLSAELTNTAQAAAAAAAGNANVVALQAAVNSGGLVSTGNNIKNNLATQLTTLDSATASLDSRINTPLSAYTSLTSAVVDVYNALPTPKSREVASVTSTVNDVENQMVRTPTDVRAQVTNVQSSFGKGVNDLRSKVIRKVDDFQDKNQSKLNNADKQRYVATVVLFAISAFFVLLLFLFVSINCPWGIGAAIVLCLFMTILLYLLSVLFAAGLVAAQDGCYYTETVALNAIGNTSNIQPIMRYYILDANTNVTVKSVLKTAKLVDVDSVTSKVTDQAKAILTNITATYTPRPKLQNVLDGVTGFINNTLARIDDLLLMASAQNVRPIYVEVKEFPCCDLAGNASKTWVILTFGGWLIMLAVQISFGHLSRLDQLPQSGCCGCKPLLLRKLQAQVHPDGGLGDEEKGQATGHVDADGAVKAVVLSAPPAGQAMMMTGTMAGAGAGAGAGAEMAMMDGTPSAPPAYATYPPAAVATDPYTGAPVDAYTGAPIDPYTGMAVVPTPPPPPPPPVMPPPQQAAQ
ncbi:hypothetical protein HYH02_000059 [Chlamydomonas schloesseri]|uniref:Uncharacterized protein n=1 Tax=Chlamydomonas schloesseri TaxID=2026947 RepID=A0A835WNL8_9CHLO|nr:hypothetical protein HYH02_000059 [Chlamydomonas schloesseri]|eukprot:KAG2449955.1 hypothetical protein HYH02_000059 [Chlamydomonas schloesseri]